MKKNSLLIFFLASLFIGLTGCDDKAPPTATEYTVTFDAGTGGTLTGPATVKVKEGEKVAEPTDPTRDGFAFSGWQDADSKTFDFNTAIAADITLTAGWKSAGAVSNVVIELDTTARPTEFRVASYVYTDGDGTVVPNSTAEVKWFVSDNSDGTSATEVSTGATYSPVGVSRYKFVSASVRVEAAENIYTPEEKSTTSLFAGFSTGSINKFTGSRNAGAVNFNGKMWVIGGFDANNNRIDEVWSSSDGATWAKETLTSSFGAREKHTVLSFNKKMWIIGGTNDGFTGLDDVWSSEDGVKWTQSTIPSDSGFTVRYDHSSVVFNNKMWVIAGNGGFGVSSLADVWSSENGTTWVQSVIPSGSGFSRRHDHTSVVHDGKMWIIGGYSGDYLNDVWSSSDGATWKRVLENAGFSARSQHTSVLFDNNIFVLGGTKNGLTPLDDVWY